jgi:hypothetical protein
MKKEAGFFLVLFARERAPFEKHMRIERFAGELENEYSV